MAKKLKIKLKQGKAKIKLKSDEALPWGNDLRQLLSVTLAPAIAAPPVPAVSGLLPGPEKDRSE